MLFLFSIPHIHFIKSIDITNSSCSIYHTPTSTFGYKTKRAVFPLKESTALIYYFGEFRKKEIPGKSSFQTHKAFRSRLLLFVNNTAMLVIYF